MEIDNDQARLDGDLTFTTVTRLHHQMQDIAKKGPMPRSIDLSGVRQIDSAGLALLLEWHSAYRKRTDGDPGAETDLEIRNPPESLRKIARLCDAEQYFTTVQTPGAASAEPN